MILVDTSVLVDFFRGKTTPAVEQFRRLEEEKVPFVLPLFCCQELLQGAKDEREWRLLHEYLGTQRLLEIPSGWQTHADAARIYFDCRRKGLTVRSSVDCLIAQLALDQDATLLHDDDDFDRIARVRPLKALRAR